MRARHLIYGVAGALGTLAAALAAPPTSPDPADASTTITVAKPAGGHYAAPGQARHWDLWQNYCCQKRREHDPVRHYYPLVELKYSLLPQRCSCGGHACGHCGGADVFKNGAGQQTATDARRWQPDAAAQPLAAQPPVPPVVVEPRTNEEAGQTNSSTESTRQPVGQPRADSNPAPAAGPIELAPEQQPVVVPPVADPNRVPRNPLPKSNTPPKRRVVPPANSPATQPNTTPSTRPSARLIPNHNSDGRTFSLSRYIQTK